MNRKLMFWLTVLALAAAPALVSAQEGPGPEEEEEVEMMEEGPGGPGMHPGGPMGPGGRKMIVKKRMLMRGPGMGPGGLSEEKVLAVIKKHDPAFSKKVADLQEIAPAKYKLVIQMSGKIFAVAKMEQDESMEKDAVRALSLEFESKELSLKYNRASDAEKKAIKEKLKPMLSELFDLKTKGQEMRVRHMEGEIGRLKKNLESRKANKGKIVDQRLEQLTGEGYGW